jgi:heme-degrading monooxygenase HmoA
MPMIVADADYATFVNVFEVQPADQDTVVQIVIEINEEVARGAPGFISASTHRSVDGTRVFNYLQWESEEHLAAVQRSDLPRARTPLRRPDRVHPISM